MDAREFGLKLGKDAALQGLTVQEGTLRSEWEKTVGDAFPLVEDIEAFRTKFPNASPSERREFEKAYLEAAFDEAECIPAE